MNEMDRRVLSRLETTEDLRKTELDRRLENKLESLVDLRREHIAAFTTRADPHMHYFGIISNRTIQAWQGNVPTSAFMRCLDETLDRFQRAGMDDEDIRRIMGAAKGEYAPPVMTHWDREFAYIPEVGEGYMLPHMISSGRELEDIPEYREYCMNWYQEHGVSMERFEKAFNRKDQTGLYAAIGDALEKETGERPMGYIQFAFEKERERFLDAYNREHGGRDESGPGLQAEGERDEDPGDPSALDPPGAECPDGYDEEEFDL